MKTFNPIPETPTGLIVRGVFENVTPATEKTSTLISIHASVICHILWNSIEFYRMHLDKENLIWVSLFSVRKVGFNLKTKQRFQMNKNM